MTDTSVLPQITLDTVTDSPAGALDQWVADFFAATGAKDVAATAELFQSDAVARDLLACGWDFRNGVNRTEVAELFAGAAATPLTELSVRAGFQPIVAEEAGALTTATFLTFHTGVGTGNGYLKLVREEDGAWRAAALSLALDELANLPKQHGALRPQGRTKTPERDRKMWAEEFDPEFLENEPQVVIVGAGHNGMMLATRLQVMGIRTLLIERNDRVGDNWRKRYASLALHTPLQSDSLPYLPFPATWTQFTPKDKLGDFLESYATLMDLRVWTGSTASNYSYDSAAGRWTLDVTRPDGSVRTLNPQHLVIAPGLLAEPLRPQMPGQDAFRGTVLHTADYQGYRDFQGKRAVVVGSGVSGHDIAQDLAEHGVDVTMVQRSETLVLSTASFHKVMHANHTSGRYTIEDADLVNSATPFGELPRYGAAQLQACQEMDAELLDGLRKAGFKLGSGPDGTGVLGLIYRLNGTGYYYDAGASQLIVDGTIKLAHGSVTSFTETGIVLNDGAESIEADLVVFATGYRGPESVVRQMFGDEVAEHLGNFADVGEDREYGRLWRRTGIDNFWFMIALGIGDGRFYSNLLALQIAADITGVAPDVTTSH